MAVRSDTAGIENRRGAAKPPSPMHLERSGG
jgi:hypothetical protein